MNKHHKELLGEILKSSKSGRKTSEGSGYLGTEHILYKLSSGEKNTIFKNWQLKNQDLSFKDFQDLVVSLSGGKSYDEKSMAGRLLAGFPKHRHELNPLILDKLLEGRVGWAEVDGLCQSTFSAGEILADWKTWEKTLKKLNKDKSVSKRRASLVLITRAVRETEDSRISSIAFENIDNLKLEKDILITKAISWLLRDLIKNNRADVEKYLRDNENMLPKIAVRETKNKLKYGKKSSK